MGRSNLFARVETGSTTASSSDKQELRFGGFFAASGQAADGHWYANGGILGAGVGNKSDTLIKPVTAYGLTELKDGDTAESLMKDKTKLDLVRRCVQMAIDYADMVSAVDDFEKSLIAAGKPTKKSKSKATAQAAPATTGAAGTTAAPTDKTEALKQIAALLGLTV